MRHISDYREQLKEWLPPTSLKAIREEVVGLAESVFGDSVSNFRFAPDPKMDVAETARSVEITIELPGVRKEDMDLQVTETSLTISGARSQGVSAELDERKFHRVERPTGSFSRTISLPSPVNAAEIDAQLVAGVLKVVLSKRADSIPRKVEIKETQL
ncbi:Hsp20/alpha crystallin family protein [Planctomicrobium sp. SH668]|uniref:Hsp20/alpha crystallin family protein n=1 Tax=Planctomicrobium sp. SH668 TaxID=3448126 RepID=UPI003F5C0A2E